MKVATVESEGSCGTIFNPSPEFDAPIDWLLQRLNHV